MVNIQKSKQTSNKVHQDVEFHDEMFPISTPPQVSSDGLMATIIGIESEVRHYSESEPLYEDEVMSGECPPDQQPVISSRAGQRRKVPLTRSRRSPSSTRRTEVGLTSCSRGLMTC